GRRRGLRRDADLDAARRADRVARVRRLSSQATEARHRPQPPDRKRSTHSAGKNHSLQAGQRSAEHRIIVRVDPARLDQPSPTPPDFPFRWEPRRKFQDRIWWHALLLVLTIGTTTYLGVERYLAFVLDFA